MKARTSRPSLSDKLTLSLITAGLARGITHSSLRRMSPPPEQVTVSSVRVGGGVDAPRVACLYWSDRNRNGFDVSAEASE
jgi:hypothetical protein